MWQWLWLGAALPSPLALLWLPESPKFLLEKRHDPEAALAVLVRIARVNGRASSMENVSRRL